MLIYFNNDENIAWVLYVYNMIYALVLVMFYWFLSVW